MLARLVSDLPGQWHVLAIDSGGYVAEESVFDADDADGSHAMADFVTRLERQGFGMLQAAERHCGCKRPTLRLVRTH